MIAFGHIPDDTIQSDQHLDKHLSQLIGAERTTFPASVEYRDLMPPVRDQRGNSCVGEAIAAAVIGVSRIAQRPVQYPSPLALYTLGRQYDAYGGILTDIGSRPRAVIKAAQDFGLVALERWEPDDVNDEVPLDVLTAGSDALLTDAYRIDDGDIVSALCMALSNGFLPAFGMGVDDAYTKYSGGLITEIAGASIGGHMQLITGYDEVSFTVRNSWGAGWGDGGYSHISKAFIAGPTCFDRTTITISPRVIR